MCPSADFNRQKLNICTNLQKKHSNGNQVFLLIMELLSNVHHIRKMDFVHLPQICK